MGRPLSNNDRTPWNRLIEVMYEVSSYKPHRSARVWFQPTTPSCLQLLISNKGIRSTHTHTETTASPLQSSSCPDSWIYPLHRAVWWKQSVMSSQFLSDIRKEFIHQGALTTSFCKSPSVSADLGHSVYEDRVLDNIFISFQNSFSKQCV